MANPKYLIRDVATGQVKEVIAAEFGPAPEQIVSTRPDGIIDESLLPPSVTGMKALQVLVDFGFSAGNEGDIARTTVTGLTWVLSNSIIICGGAAIPTPDHSGDDMIAEGIVAYAENLVAGVGFDVVAYAPQNTWGRYYINAIGQ